MTPLQLALALSAMLLLLGWLRVRQRAAPPAVDAAPDDERLDTLMGWPPEATRVLSGHERVAYSALVRALPECMVLAQVPMSRFLNVPKRNSYADWLRRVGYQCVDFAICDKATQVIAVVELQVDSQTPTGRARKRIARMTRALEAAKIPMLNWRADALPSSNGIRDAILPRVATMPYAQAMAASASPDISPSGQGGFNPFEDSKRDASQDEVIELLEPPPSTWFDDLDSAPMPLTSAAPAQTRAH